MEWLKSLNLEILVIDCLRNSIKIKSHLIVEETVHYIRRIEAKKSVTTGMSHGLNYNTDHNLFTVKKYKGHVLMGYDGILFENVCFQKQVILLVEGERTSAN